ncbi:hypothetical protein L6R50_24140, partial [Myxococcota bacterium]|nr:hypothetical protein [Myxococcota bacterium]
CAWEEGDDGTWYCGEPVQTELQVLSGPLPLYPRPTRLRADVSGQSDMGTLFTDVAADAPYDVLPLLDAAGVDGPSTSSQLMRVSGEFDVVAFGVPLSCVGLTGDEALLCPLARLREDVEARGMSMRSYGAVFQGQAVTYDDAHKSHLPNTGYADCEYSEVLGKDNAGSVLVGSFSTSCSDCAGTVPFHEVMTAGAAPPEATRAQAAWRLRGTPVAGRLFPLPA